jgi:flagella basal body P-ring formation protein FlgA
MAPCPAAIPAAVHTRPWPLILALAWHLGWWLVLCLLGTGLGAAEISFHARCQPAGRFVLLGDVAEIAAREDHQAQALSQVELFPAPASGEQSVTAREVQEALLARGIPLGEHTFCGASRIVIVPPRWDEAAQPPADKGSPPPRRAVKKVCDAIARWLSEHVSAGEAWEVELQGADRLPRELGTSEIVSVRPLEPGLTAGSDGTHPAAWTGTHAFAIETSDDQGPRSWNIESVISLPPTVVVAAQGLPKGTILQQAHLRLQRGHPAHDSPRGIKDLADAIGREATRNIGPGQILTPDLVRSQQLVQQGDVVTVFVTSGAVRLRTNARARESGSLGQAITVESLTDRKVFSARISGLHEVTIAAGSTPPQQPVRPNTTAPAVPRAP